MGKILTDTCVFIDIFRGDGDLYQYLKTLTVSINSIVYMELIQGARDKSELKNIDNFLKEFNVIPIDEEISHKSIELMKKYNLSHGLLLPDAMVAATAIVRNCSLWTLNLKDFKFIKGLTFFTTTHSKGKKR